jgi:hypothetical protein
MATQEFLEEMVKEAKQYLPKWLYLSLMKAARARAGGRLKGSKSCDEEEHKKQVIKAVWTTAFMNDLPDSAFLYIAPGGEKDDEGKTKPRDLRYFPFRDSTGKVDLPHLRNALARIPQAHIPQEEKDKATKRARKILDQQKERMSKADIAFVISELDPIEKARKEPLVGSLGVIFKDKYLKPLGHQRDKESIVIPSDLDTIYDSKPRVLVALGKQAAESLHGLADFTLPHPQALKYGDSGEVGRKIKQVKKFLLDSIEKEQYFCDRCSWLGFEPGFETPGNSVKINKAEKAKQIVYGVVLDPYGKDGAQADAHNDWPPPAMIEKAAHEYMKGSRVIGMQHGAKAEAQVVESWIEMYPTQEDYRKALNDEPHAVSRRPFGDDVIHSGSWVIGVQLGHDEWKAYERGDINAFSPGGIGLRTPINESMMPEVTFVDLVPKGDA